MKCSRDRRVNGLELAQSIAGSLYIRTLGGSRDGFISPAELGVLVEVSCRFCAAGIKISPDDATVELALAGGSSTLESVEAAAIYVLYGRRGLEEYVNWGIPFLGQPG